MKLLDMTCPHCNAALTIEPANKNATCPYCGATLLLDEEVVHVQYDNAEAAGYEFEKGRQRARQEAGTQGPAPKKRRTWLWVLGWIFIFPLPLTILIVPNKKIKKPLKIIILVAAWLFYLSLVIRGAVSNEDKTNQASVTEETTRAVERIQVNEPEPIQVERIDLFMASSNLGLGEKRRITADIFPKNADDKTIVWTSENEEIATVDTDGNVTAVNAGTTVITAMSSNGVSASVEITVDGTKRIMRLKVEHGKVNEVNIGDDWSNSIKINGEPVTYQYELSVGETLNFYAQFTESDEKPDMGEASTSHVVTESDLLNGFTISLDVYVTENAGRNKGQSAHFLVNFVFSAE